MRFSGICDAKNREIDWIDQYKAPATIKILINSHGKITVINEATAIGNRQYPNAQIAWKNATVLPSKIKLIVTIEAPIEMIVNTPVNNNVVWPDGAVIANTTDKNKHKKRGPHKSQSLRACSDCLCGCITINILFLIS